MKKMMIVVKIDKKDEIIADAEEHLNNQLDGTFGSGHANQLCVTIRMNWPPGDLRSTK